MLIVVILFVSWCNHGSEGDLVIFFMKEYARLLNTLIKKGGSIMLSYVFAIAVAIVALLVVCANYRYIKKLPEGTAEMSELAGTIRSAQTLF